MWLKLYLGLDVNENHGDTAVPESILHWYPGITSHPSVFLIELVFKFFILKYGIRSMTLRGG